MERGQPGQCGQLYLSWCAWYLHQYDPDHIDEDAMHTIERFIILLYDRTSTATDIDKAHHKLLAKKRPADPSDKCSPGAAYLTSSIPGWTCLESGPAGFLQSCTNH